MIPHNLITALPFWDAQNKQTFRQAYCKSNFGAIECRFDRMLPFTILNTPASSPNFVYLVQQDGTRAINLGTLISVSTATVDGKGYIYYAGASDLNQSTSVTEYSSDGEVPATWDTVGSTTFGNWVCDGGYYYLEISVGSNRYYSELMRISDFPEFSENASDETKARVRIEGTNICAVGDMPGAFNANKLFVDGNLANPEYKVEKEVGKDGQEEETPVWVKLKKRYKLTFHAVETVADWVSSLILYGGNVNVTDQYGYQDTVTDIEVETSWPEELNGCVAQIEFSYSITYLIGTGCC